MNKIAAPTEVCCPHCRTSNPNVRQVSIWLVIDERGQHFECDVCSTAFPVVGESRA